MRPLVECHSGFTYADHPIAFYWEDRRVEIEAIEAEWRTPTAKFFRVRVKEGSSFELVYHEIENEWRVTPVT